MIDSESMNMQRIAYILETSLMDRLKREGREAISEISCAYESAYDELFCFVIAKRLQSDPDKPLWEGETEVVDGIEIHYVYYPVSEDEVMVEAKHYLAG